MGGTSCRKRHLPLILLFLAKRTGLDLFLRVELSILCVSRAAHMIFCEVNTLTPIYHCRLSLQGQVVKMASS